MMEIDLIAVIWFVILSGDIPDWAKYSMKANTSNEEMAGSDRSTTTRKARKS